MYPVELSPDDPVHKDEFAFDDVIKPLLQQMVGLANCLHETAMHQRQQEKDDYLINALQLLSNHAELVLETCIAWQKKAEEPDD